MAHSHGSKPPPCSAAFPLVQTSTMLCRRRGLDLRDVWPTPQLPVSKKKQSQKRLWWCVEEAPCQGRAGGEGSCCAQRAVAGALGRCHRPVTGRVCLPHGRFPGGKTAAAWTRPAPGGPAGPGSSAQCGLPARTRGAPLPCCALGPEGGGGPGARDGRQRRGAPGSPSTWVYPRTREIATRPDARVAPSPGVPPPPRRQTRPRPCPAPSVGRRAGAEKPRESYNSGSKHSKFLLLPAWPEAGLGRVRRPGLGAMVAGRFGVNLSPFATSLARGSRFPVPSLGRRVQRPRPTGQRLDTPQGCKAPQNAPPKSRGS